MLGRAARCSRAEEKVRAPPRSPPPRPATPAPPAPRPALSTPPAPRPVHAARAPPCPRRDKGPRGRARGAWGGAPRESGRHWGTRWGDLAPGAPVLVKVLGPHKSYFPPPRVPPWIFCCEDVTGTSTVLPTIRKVF